HREQVVVVVGGQLHAADRDPLLVPVALDVVEVALHVADGRILLAPDGAGQAEGPEAGGDPAVPPDALPDAWAPGVVPQAEAVGQLEPLAVDLDRAGDRHVLLGVASGEAAGGVGIRLLALLVLGLAPERSTEGGDPQV